MKLKDKKIKVDDYVSKLQMKCLYWDRLREKLDTNKEPGYNKPFINLLMKLGFSTVENGNKLECLEKKIWRDK